MSALRRSTGMIVMVVSMIRIGKYVTRTRRESAIGTSATGSLLNTRGSARTGRSTAATRISDVRWQESPGQALLCYPMLVYTWKQNLVKVCGLEDGWRGL
jgi:hypothetical protein